MHPKTHQRAPRDLSRLALTLGFGSGHARHVRQVWRCRRDAPCQGGAAALVAALCLPLLLAGCGGKPGAPDYPRAKWCPRLADGGMEKGRAGRKIDLIVLYTTEHPADYARKLWRESGSFSGHFTSPGKGRFGSS